MSALSIGFQNSRLVLQGIKHKRPGGEMVAFIRLNGSDEGFQSAVIFEVSCMQEQFVSNRLNPPKGRSLFGISVWAYQTMNLISPGEKIFGKIAPILSCDASDQCFFHMGQGEDEMVFPGGQAPGGLSSLRLQMNN